MYGIVPTFIKFLMIISRRAADACVCDFDSRSDRCGFFFMDTRKWAASVTDVNRLWLRVRWI